MSTHYTFPFCALDNIGNTYKVSGSISIRINELDISKKNTFELITQTWQTQIPNNTISVEVNDDFLEDTEMNFEITVEMDNPTALILVFSPKLEYTQNVDAHIVPRNQKILGTDFANNRGWYNLPLHSGQTGTVTIQTYVQETPNSVLSSIAENITFREKLTYIEQPAKKPGMSIEENIEYYLGKDKFKNLFFDKTIPASWEIPARFKNSLTIKNLNSIGFFKGDSTEYYYNNLGYRSTRAYDDTLPDKVIICLGDSDAFGIGVEQDKIWSSQIEQQTGITTMNMGVPGTSVDGLTRIGVQTIQALEDRIAAVFVHYPALSLREFVSKKYKGGVHTHRNYNLPYADWWDHIDWQSNNYNFNKNRLLLENTCLRYGVKFFDLTINREDSKVPFDFVEYGVYTSIGPNTHRAIANYFVKKLNNEPSLFQTLQS